MSVEDLLQKLHENINKLSSVKECMKLEEVEARIKEIDIELLSEDIWSKQDVSSRIMKEKTNLSKKIESFSRVENSLKDLLDLLEIADVDGDEVVMKEIDEVLSKNIEEVRILELQSMFTDNEDTMDSFVEINAGAGGTDSQDWASMLLRMYQMWADKKSYKFEIIDTCFGEECGIKSVIVAIRGYLAFGYLKNENGIHRLVRISPFNANGKRQTSFASVFAYPLVGDDIEIDINEKDLQIDTYRSSGAGGQHVNTTDSAVRITHLPTGIVVQCQTERSQIQNRATAMNLLRAKMYEAEMQKRNAEKLIIESGKADISWGNQIRNYVLNPYKLVKDLRSGFETGNVGKILDGDLDEIMEGVILAKAKK